jgi:AraC-like DNA-binding protein
MLLDKLLDYVVVHVEPFATCLINSGWRLNLPGPPNVMFHFVMQGSGVLRVPDGRTYPMERFSLAVVPRDAKHTLACGVDTPSELTIESPPTGAGIVKVVTGAASSAEFQVACGMVNVTYGDSLGLFRRLDEVIVADLSGFPQVRGAFEGILDEQGGETNGSATLTRTLMTQCIVYLLRYLSEKSDGRLPWLPGLEDPDLAKAVDAIFQHPEDVHTVDSLADLALMSRSVFADRFREAFGATPINFVHDMRIRKAADLLRQDGGLTVEQVAHRVGFNSRTHFSSAFKSHFGVTPNTFQKGQSFG